MIFLVGVAVLLVILGLWVMQENGADYLPPWEKEFPFVIGIGCWAVALALLQLAWWAW